VRGLELQDGNGIWRFNPFRSLSQKYFLMRKRAEQKKNFSNFPPANAQRRNSECETFFPAEKERMKDERN
jgi:hypothetical protein